MAKSDNQIKAGFETTKSKNKNTIKIINNLQAEKLAEIVAVLYEIKNLVASLNQLFSEFAKNSESGE